MLKLFFDLGDKIQFDSDYFIEVTNKLDSHQYIVQKVIEPQNHHVKNTYFVQQHQHICTYYNCWMQTQTLTDIPVTPKINKKKLTLATMLSKKVKGQPSSPNKIPSKNKITADQIITKQVEVMYIQLESFKPYKVPNKYHDCITFIAIVYLMAVNVHKQLGVWPKMIPYYTQDGKIKFLKKGKQQNQQLYNLFKYCKYQDWKNIPQHFQSAMMKQQIDSNRQLIIQLLKKQINSVITMAYPLAININNQILSDFCIMNKISQLSFQKVKIIVNLYDFEIQCSYLNQQNLQIILKHPFMQSIVIIGNRNNFIIKYLKKLQL